MSAYKLQRIGTETFLSTTATRYIMLYISGKYPEYNIDKACVKNGRVFSTKNGAIKYFERLGSWKDLFTIKELN